MALVVDVLSHMSCHHQHGFCMHHRLGVEALNKFISSRHDPRLFIGQIDLFLSFGPVYGGLGSALRGFLPSAQPNTAGRHQGPILLAYAQRGIGGA